MKVGLIGAGRIGKFLAQQFALHNEVIVYDRDIEECKDWAKDKQLEVAVALPELVNADLVVLAVPDHEVINLIKEFNCLTSKLSIVSIATNVGQHVLIETAYKGITCISVKIIGHAREMALGAKPLIIVNSIPEELAEKAVELFSHIGHVRVGKADIVTLVNKTAARAALEAAVNIEKSLCMQGINDPEIIKIAISQVAAGIVKAFADGDLGPFAREIVRAVKAKSFLN